jgi:DNA polymerase
MRDFFDGRVDSFDKKAMPKLLKRTDFTPVQKELLELRAEGAKSSTAKLNAVTEFADEDGACRYMMKYFGAATGRFSAKGPQPHNLPRGSVKDPDSAINDILRGMDADGLSAFYGSPLEVVSSLIRGTIIPRKGHVFIGFDFSQIESRLTAYLCNQDDLVDVFRRGGDPYQFTSDRLGLGSRQAGKAATLGLGFGLGAKKFIEFAEVRSRTIAHELRHLLNHANGFAWIGNECGNASTHPLCAIGS